MQGTIDAGFWDHVIEHCLTGPMIPATFLAAVCLTYLVIAMLGLVHFGVGGDHGMDLDVPTTHADLHADLLGGMGAATLRAVNLDRVPLMIWLSVFSLFLWLISYLLWFQFDEKRNEPTLWLCTLLIIRNAVMAVFVTKFVTNPLHRLLVPSTQYHGPTLLGQTATVETERVDAKFGRARFRTNAAPLLLNIRTLGEVYRKGTVVELLEYDLTTRFYIVAAADENARPDSMTNRPSP